MNVSIPKLLCGALRWPFVFALLGLVSLRGQTEYLLDGEPTALEEEIRWHTNRARFDTAAENKARGTAFTDVPATARPLAPHQSLIAAARNHSQDMAAHGLMRHETLPNSAFYDSRTQPRSWDRMRAEGYAWNRVAENIAAGYTSAEAAHVAWWKSTGHRVNLADGALRELGVGYAYNANDRYRHYYTENFGSSGNAHFFTDTLFFDRNGDGRYGGNEGLARLEITLRVDGRTAGVFDRASATGSFAVPLQTLSARSEVAVVIHNPASETVRVTLPRSYYETETVEIPARGSRVAGTFLAPARPENFGFRNLTPWVEPPVVSEPPTLVLEIAGRDVVLTWSSQTGVSYQPQFSIDLLRWENLSAQPLPGTGALLSWKHAEVLAQLPAQGFHRVLQIAAP